MMELIIGILDGALVVGLVCSFIYFDRRLTRMRTKDKPDPCRTSYSNYTEKKRVKTECERATETLGELIAEMERARKLKAELDNIIDEGLILLEEYDKRRIDDQVMVMQSERLENDQK